MEAPPPPPAPPPKPPKPSIWEITSCPKCGTPQGQWVAVGSDVGCPRCNQLLIDIYYEIYG